MSYSSSPANVAIRHSFALLVSLAAVDVEHVLRDWRLFILDSTRSQSKANEFSPRGLLVMDASLDLTSSSQQSQVSTVAPKVK